MPFLEHSNAFQIWQPQSLTDIYISYFPIPLTLLTKIVGVGIISVICIFDFTPHKLEWWFKRLKQSPDMKLNLMSS